MEETLNNLLVECLQIGISINDFWEMDFCEIQFMFDAFQARKEHELRQTASMHYKLAMLIGAFTGSLFGSQKPPTLYESYPELYKKEYEEEQWKQYQNQMLQFAHLQNLKRQTRNQQEDLKENGECSN